MENRASTKVSPNAKATFFFCDENGQVRTTCIKAKVKNVLN